MADHLVSDATARRLDRQLAQRQAQGRIPSLVMAVVRDSQCWWSGARGGFPDGVDPVALPYRIGSITKTFVAVAVLRLRDAGRLRLNDSVETHLPGTPFADRTIAQLLAHTGGITAEPPGSWWERSPGVDSAALWAATAGGDPVRRRAGRGYHYSNLGFAVLGEIVARAHGRAWHEVVSEEILAPLEMRATSVAPGRVHARGLAVHPFADVVLAEQVQDTGAMGPAGQLWSTVADLCRWAAFVDGDTAGVVSGDTVAEMCEPQSVKDQTQWTRGHGLGLELRREGGRVLVGHSGSMPGFQAGLWVDRATHTGLVSVLNCTSPGEVSGAEDVFDVMDSGEPPLPPVWVPQESVPGDVLELTGSWFWGTSEGVLRVEADGWLRIDRVSGMVSTSRFRPRADGTWIGCDGYYRDEVLRVVRDAGGAVRHLDVGTFVFTRRAYDPADSVPGGLADGGDWPVR